MQGLFEAAWFQLAVKIILSAVIVCAVAFICALLVLWLQRRVRIRRLRDHTIYIKNQGNLNSLFYLTAESAEPLLKFRFFQNGIPLSEVQENVETAAVRVELPAAHPEPAQNPAMSAPQSKSIPSRIGSDSMEKFKSAGKAGEKLAAKSGAAASLLGVLGSLLPGDLGKSIKEQGNAVRGVQTKTKNIMDQPQAMQRKLDQVQKDGGKLGVKTPSAALPSLGQGKPALSEPDQVEANPQVQSAKPEKPAAETAKTIQYYSTAEVEPGEIIGLTLRIESKKRTKPEGSFLYTIKSRQVAADQIEKKNPFTVRQGMVNFDHTAIVKFYLADILCALFILAGLLAALFGISLVW